MTAYSQHLPKYIVITKQACILVMHHEFNQVLLDKFQGITLHLQCYLTESGARIKHLFAPFYSVLGDTQKVQSISLNIFEQAITPLHFNMFSKEQSRLQCHHQKLGQRLVSKIPFCCMRSIATHHNGPGDHVGVAKQIH